MVGLFSRAGRGRWNMLQRDENYTHAAGHFALSLMREIPSHMASGLMIK